MATTEGMEMVGGDGNEVFVSGPGADTIDGGGGTDVVSYHRSTEQVNVNLGGVVEEPNLVPPNVNSGYAEGDQLTNIEDIIGSDFNDHLRGSNGNNQLLGGMGNDSISGAEGDDWVSGEMGDDDLWGDAGNDVLAGGMGSDVIKGGTGHDVIEGGAGSDTLDGGAGQDWVEYTQSMEGVTVDLGSMSPASGGDAHGDVIMGFEHAKGGDADDRLIGNGGANHLIGKMGNDELWSGAGNDVLSGGAGNDALDGGAGNDGLWGGMDNDSLWGGMGNDTLWGDEGADQLVGGGGDDLISYIQSPYGVEIDLRVGMWQGGGMGSHAYGDTYDRSTEKFVGSMNDDMFYGGDFDLEFNAAGGDDLIYPGTGAERIQGEAGNDTVSYSMSDMGVTVDLSTGHGSGGHAMGDYLRDVENLDGSMHADMLTGDMGSNMLRGMGGADTIYGGAGADMIYGGAGADMIDGGMGADMIDGGMGADMIDGGMGADMITGDAGNDMLGGGTGADAIDSGAGDDMITGGLGDDTLTSGAGADVLVFGLVDPLDPDSDVVMDFDNASDRLDVSALVANGMDEMELQAVLDNATYSDAGMMLDFRMHGGGTIQLTGYTRADELDIEDDFILS